jgi:3-oxoacyl-[acyl-carrier protein] reductase
MESHCQHHLGDRQTTARDAHSFQRLRAGVVTLSKTQSNQCAKDNVLINTVCPGIILTDRVDQVVENLARTQGISQDAALQNSVKPIPMGRPGQPKKFAEMVMFLCSECCSYATGTVTQIDGGFVLGVFLGQKRREEG